MASQVDICNLAFDLIGENIITTINEGTKQANVANRNWSNALDAALRMYPWHFAQKHFQLEYSTGFGVYDEDSDTYTISGATKADPCVLTITSHGFSDGHHIYVYDVVGMTELNQRVFEVANQAVNSVELRGINSTLYTTYVSGGKAIRLEALSKYGLGYTYDLPEDYIAHGRLENWPDEEFEIVGHSPMQRLLTTVSDAILIYTAQITDTTLFPTHFIDALTGVLAKRFFRKLAKKGGRDIEEIHFEADQLIAAAKNADSFESKQDEGNYDDPWLKAAGYI